MFKVPEEFKDWLARRMKVTEEGLNSLRPFYWPIIIIQSTFWTALKIANYLGLPESLFVGGIISAGSVAVAAFVYVTYHWDLHNRMGKVNEEISSNFTSPTTMINMEISAEQQAKNIELMSKVWPGEKEYSFEEAYEEVMEQTEKAVSKRKDGVNYDKY